MEINTSYVSRVLNMGVVIRRYENNYHDYFLQDEIYEIAGCLFDEEKESYAMITFFEYLDKKHIGNINEIKEYFYDFFKCYGYFENLFEDEDLYDFSQRYEYKELEKLSNELISKKQVVLI